MQLVLQHGGATLKTAKAKLDSRGSVSIAHGNLLNHFKPARSYNLPNIRLRGIGGKTEEKNCDILSYVFNEVVGQTEEMLLINLSAIIDGAPRIMTKYKDTPYSYELQLEYAAKILYYHLIV